MKDEEFEERGTRMPREYCEGKPVYDKRSAITARNKRWEDSHVKLRVYPCNFCGGWHLTHQKKFSKRDYDYLNN